MAQSVGFTKATGTRVVDATRQVEDWQSSGRGQHRQKWPTHQRPKSNERIGIVVGYGNPMDRFVQVIEPVFNDSDPWDGGWIIPVAEPGQPSMVEPVWCYPPLRAVDYEEFVLEGGPPGQPMVLTDDMDPCPVVRIRGVWFIKQEMLFGFKEYPVGAEYSDCSATGDIP